MNNDTQPLTPEQQETLQAQNEMAAAAQEQYEQIKQALSWKISTLPIEDQAPPQTFTSGIIPDKAYQQAWETWKQTMEDYQKEPEHVHGPFTFLLNQNHNALRGCQSCGATWVGVMAGTEDDIRWHEVQEPPEEE